MDHIEIEYSNGRGKYGKQFAYVRPAQKCHNRSRRFAADALKIGIEKYFPEVFYYEIEGKTIGAKNEDFALKEWWRICSEESIGIDVPVKKLL